MEQLPWTENWEPSYRITVGVKPVVDSYTADELVAIPTSLQRSDIQQGVETKPAYSKFISNLVDDGFDRDGYSFTFDGNNALSPNGSDSENSTLELWNINSEFSDILNTEGAVIIIEAGYQQKVVQFYSGDVVSVKTRKSSEGTAHIIKCATNAQSAKNTIVNLRYSEDISERDVIIDMAGRFSGTAIGTVGLNDLNDRYRTGGRTFVGSLVTNFDKIMSKHNLSYAHINGKIVLVPYRIKGQDYETFVKTNYTLSLDSIIEIEDTSDKAGSGSADEKSKLREVTLNTFFLPVELGQVVTIPDSDFTKIYRGTYLVKANRYLLDTVSGTWLSVLKLEAL
ncbi:hypothetical protein NVP1187O_185 [Vibrio phage 1.187.O._10N.286.49.F1]|nr:hypothetical protein NVP1187O_185 [Vibrio phage 1.187.O._10N.286.49.F1]